MTIPNTLSQFTDEADFRDRFVIPLLHRLGFSVVVNYHGQREFGRDIIFGEIDRFGHVLYYALQAKYVGSISQSESHGLIADARESFAHDFSHPQKQTQERVCRFYVVNAGSIAKNARDNFFALLERPLGANSVLLDGPSLLAFDRFAAITRGAMTRDFLSGQLIEIRWNRSVALDRRLNEFTSTGNFPIDRLRLVATIAMLERPVILEAQFLSLLEEYWRLASTTNRIVDAIDVPFLSAGSRNERVSFAIEQITRLATCADALESALIGRISELGSTIV